MTRHTDTINYPVAKAAVLHVPNSSSEEGRAALQTHLEGKTFEQRAREILLGFGFKARQITRAETRSPSRLSRMLKQALGGFRKLDADTLKQALSPQIWLNQATQRSYWRSLESDVLTLFVPLTLHPAIQQNAPN